MRGTPAASLLCLAILFAGCSSPPGDDPPDATGPPDPNLHAYVSNQSFDQPTADIQVTIDGVVLFDGEARVEGQHNWMLPEARLVSGAHTVEAVERDSGVRESRSFMLPPGQHRWIVVDFWNPAGDDEGPGFTITVHDEQVAFA